MCNGVGGSPGGSSHVRSGGANNNPPVASPANPGSGGSAGNNGPTLNTGPSQDSFSSSNDPLGLYAQPPGAGNYPPMPGSSDSGNGPPASQNFAVQPGSGHNPADTGSNNPPGNNNSPSPSGNPPADGPVPGNLQDIDTKYGAQVQQIVDATNAKTGAHLTKTYVEAEIMQESGGDPNNVGDGGTSKGLLQVNNNAEENNGGNQFDVANNLTEGIGEMAKYFNKYNGDLSRTASAYETGDSYYDPTYSDSVLAHMNGN